MGVIVLIVGAAVVAVLVIPWLIHTATHSAARAVTDALRTGAQERERDRFVVQFVARYRAMHGDTTSAQPQPQPSPVTGVPDPTRNDPPQPSGTRRCVWRPCSLRGIATDDLRCSGCNVPTEPLRAS